ncbi:hypothetical protein AB4Y38_36775 [Paraburkholderia sp. EG285A]|uniref:hypothetical protein n=1 Tax=Paraburkholderia sp. EG285A TaxID=3237009 RepID=UPI0034D30E38
MSSLDAGKPMRLSLSVHSQRPRRPFTQLELSALRAVADCLIPGIDGKISGGSVDDFDGLVTKVAALTGGKFEQLAEVLGPLSAVQASEMWGFLRAMNDQRPSDFYLLSMVVSAAYIYSDEIQSELNYPRPHQNPFGLFDVADELETGILDGVIARGKIYVDAK